MNVEHCEWWLVGGHYTDKIVSSSGQGKCTFDIEKSSHKRNFTQSNKKNTSFIITNSVSYWDSSTWTYLEFEHKNSEDNCETSNAERRALDTHTLSLLCYSGVEVKLEFDMLITTYLTLWIRNLGREKKTHIFFPTCPFWMSFLPVQ